MPTPPGPPDLHDRFLKLAGEPPYYIDNVSVVFIDLVAFSSLKGGSNLHSKVEDMQDVIRAVLDPHYYWDEVKKTLPNRVIVIPTGDGYAIAFHPSVDRREVLNARVDDLYMRLKSDKSLEFRMGISRGPHICFIDLNNNLNLIGEGIIRAQRAMMLAAPGQVLCTGEFADGLEPEVTGDLTPIDGKWRIKNESPFRLFNYTSVFGTKRRPIGVVASPDERFRVAD